MGTTATIETPETTETIQALDFSTFKHLDVVRIRMMGRGFDSDAKVIFQIRNVSTNPIIKLVRTPAGRATGPNMRLYGCKLDGIPREGFILPDSIIVLVNNDRYYPIDGRVVSWTVGQLEPGKRL